MHNHKKYRTLILDGKEFPFPILNDFSKFQTTTSSVPDWGKDIFKFILEWLNESPTIEAQTSGTTGTPKKILLEKNKMIASALKTGAYFNLKKNDKALLCLSPNYIAGKIMIVRAFVLGLDLRIVEPRGNPLKDASFEEIDFAAMVPLQVMNSFQNDSTKLLFRKIKKTIIGGGVVSKTLHEILQKEKNNFYATYGMTETVTHIAIKKLNGASANDNYETLENVAIKKDKRGCLVIDAPDVTHGEVVTNDLVNIISPNQFQWLGRHDNIINSGGVKIIPEKVERTLSKFLNQRFFISSQPDELLGNRIILIIKGSIFSQKEKEDLSTFMKNNLSKFSVPKEVFFIEKFIETDSGKIKRTETLNLL